MTHGAEQFCQGILDADNRTNDKFAEVQSFFNEVKLNEQIYYGQIKSEVAILYDYDNRWSWHAQPQSHAFDFTREFVRHYAGFYEKNVMTDVINIDHELTEYKIVVLPVMQIVDSILLEKLKQFALQGGTVVFGFRSGIKDRNNNLRLGPNVLSEVCGIEFAGYESLGHGQSVEISDANGEAGEIFVWRDLIKTIQAKMLYHYRDDFYKDYAAVTVNAYGKGWFYYIGGGVCKMTTRTITHRILTEQSISFIESPEGVEVVARDGHFLVLNHTADVQAFRGKKIEPYGTALI